MNGKCESILIVEDDKDIQDILKISLEMEGYKVHTADNGKEGLDLLPEITRPCLILLDLMMPVMNGWEFVETMSKNDILATIPIVIITAFGDRANVPAKAVLKKPIDLDALYGLVGKWCNKSQTQRESEC